MGLEREEEREERGVGGGGGKEEKVPPLAVVGESGCGPTAMAEVTVTSLRMSVLVPPCPFRVCTRRKARLCNTASVSTTQIHYLSLCLPSVGNPSDRL